jgi:photosystem II stability/assembly factor-like uncharacterized protein
MLLAKKIAAWLAVVLFAAATAIALLQPVYPNPFRPEVGLDRFLYPTETNAFTRLPSITTHLNDLEVKVGEDGQTNLWVVGDGGAILHSPDGGRCWEAQGTWAPKDTQPTCGPRDLWDRMELIPTATAGQAAPTQTPVQAPISAALKPGQSSPEVPRWRSALREAGYETGEAPADPETNDKGMAPAVAAFQRDKGFAADGLISNQTRVLLDALPSPSASGIGSEPIGSEPTDAMSQSGRGQTPAETTVMPPGLNAVDFLDAQTGWAVGANGTILKTTDKGMRWTPQTSGNDQSLSAVQFLDAQTGWAVGESGTILKTSDGGATWLPQSSGTKSWLTAVQFVDVQTGWTVGRAGTILKTVDGGAIWEPQASGTQTSLSALQFLDTQIGWAVGDGGTILKTVHGGATWEPQASGTSAWLSAVQFRDAQTGWAVGDERTILNTIDGGATWVPQDSSTEASFYAVQFRDAKIGWAAGSEGTILKTTDGGATWVPQTRGTKSLLYGVQFPDAQTGWVVGDEGTILKTIDGGATWVPQDSSTEASLYAVQFFNAWSGWTVGGDGTILRSDDGGATWVPQASGTNTVLNAVQFLDAQTGWVVGDEGTILKTGDGGTTWKPQASSTKALLTAAHFLDAQTGWVVGDEGTILNTSDGGATWKSPLAPYSIGPAPWYWGACLLSIALLVFSAWPQRPEVTERGVADLLASDRPLRDKGEADALDLGVIAASLSEFLRNRHTEAPLTVAVTGDWGSGKTSLMNLLRQDLMDKRFRPVWFNAWHHQKGEQILASLFAHIREQSIPPLASWRGLRFRWQLLVRRGVPVWLPVTLLLFVLALLVGYLWKEFPVYVVSIWAVLCDPEQLWHKDWQTLTRLFTVLAGIGGSILGLVHTLQGFGLDPKKLVTVNPENRKAQGLDPGARARFAREFRDVTECLKPRKMVIFIDDLDRCSQQSLIEVLEAINFLASSGDCFILMGMSPGWVEACVGLEYEHTWPGPWPRSTPTGTTPRSDPPSRGAASRATTWRSSSTSRSRYPI